MKVSPLYIYRKTNFPVEYVSFLLEDTAEKYIQYLTDKNELANKTEKETICLEEEIKKISDDKIRKRLINCKRDIYNMREKSEEKFKQFIDVIDPEIFNKINNIILQQKKLKDQLKQIENEFETSAIKECEGIQNIFYKDKQLKNALILTNEMIVNKIDKYLITPLNDQERSLRKIETVLTRFLTRATLKVSPMANLAFSGIATDDVYGKDVKKLFASVSANVVLRIFDKICAQEDIMKTLNYRLCKTLMKKEGKYYFTVLHNQDISNALHKSKQVVCALKENRLFDVLFNELENKNYLSYKDMIDFIKKFKVEEAVAENLIRNLIKQGILEKDVYLDEQAEDINDEIISYLQKLNYDENSIDNFRELKDVLEGIKENISKEEIDRAYELIEGLLKKTGIKEIKRRNLIYIDGIDYSLPEKNEKIEKEILELLYKYQMITVALDPIIKQKFIIGDYFLKKYGEEYIPDNTRSISAILRELSQIFFLSEDQTKAFWGEYDWNKKYQNKDAGKLNDIAKNLVYDLKEQIDKREIVLTDKYLDELVNSIKDIIKNQLISHSLFIQNSKDGSKAVVNHLYKGYGTYFARFLKYFDDLGLRYKEYVDECFNNEGVADIRNTFGFNANIRADIVNKQFRLPFDDEKENILGWEDIGFRYNKNNRVIEFFDKKTKETVKPQFLGTLVPLAVPPLMSTFDMISSHSTIYFDLGELIIRTILKEQGGLKKDVLHVPRISIGSNASLIVSRSKWLVKSNVIKDLYKQKNKTESWEKIIHVFISENIPMKFFIKAFNISVGDININSSDRKPQFINMSSPKLIELLIQILNKNDYVIIEEEFPVNRKCNNVVKEYIYEITHKGEIGNENN